MKKQSPVAKNEAVKIKGLYVEVRAGNSQNRKDHEVAVAHALSELKRDVKKEGLMQELRRRESYMSPSKYRRFKHNEAVKQKKRDERKVEWSGKSKSNY